MTLTEMRRLLLETLEVEEEDWPQPLMEASISEGYDRILAEDSRWPWLEARWEAVVEGGSGVVPMGSDIDGMQEVVSVRVGGDKLVATDEDSALQKHGDSTGRPSEWTRWAGELRVWPAPSTDTVVNVHGYRVPRPFEPLGGWEPDMPAELHWLLLDWALANEFQRQEDTEMMFAYRQKFDSQLRATRRRVKATPAPTPLVVGGDGSRMRHR